MTRPGAPLGKLMARAVRGLGSHPEPDDIETRLLDAAIEVLSERGTQTATIDEVARRAKVGRATSSGRLLKKCASSWTSYRRVRAGLTILVSGSQRDSLSASRL
ncbi:TetR family transcriptional regulator [Mycobacteroides abscessus subsp. abscessus]|nr:TetR family transcriptional regulator [Mycobacteroides abscessus subsp. abscessus]